MNAEEKFLIGAAPFARLSPFGSVGIETGQAAKMASHADQANVWYGRNT